MREAVIPLFHAAGLIAATCLLACAGGSAVNAAGGNGGHAGQATTTTSQQTGGKDAGQGGKGGDGGKGGSGPVGDAIPLAAVSYFQGSSCPVGWAPHDTGVGRIAVPTVGDALGGATTGEPLKSGEDRKHTHELHASFTLPAFSYAGIAGEANHGVAAAGTHTATAPMEPVSAGIPYVQLLACKKLVDPVPGAAPLPAGMLMFFESVACPEGWKQAVPTQGRLMVGLPDPGEADATFGGAQLANLDPRTHVHGTDVKLVTSPHGIALASGCCAGGYGSDGTYTSSGDSGATDLGLPVVTLLQCQKM